MTKKRPPACALLDGARPDSLPPTSSPLFRAMLAANEAMFLAITSGNSIDVDQAEKAYLLAVKALKEHNLWGLFCADHPTFIGQDTL